MQRTSWQTLLVLVLLVGGVSYAGLAVLESRRGTLLPVPGLLWAALAILALVLLLLGVSVRRLAEGRRTRMDVLRAARVAMLAKACSLCGAAFTGYFAAQLLVAWANVAAPAMREHAVASAAAGVAGAVLVAVGLLVESWCRLPPEEDGEPA